MRIYRDVLFVYENISVDIKRFINFESRHLNCIALTLKIFNQYESSTVMCDCEIWTEKIGIYRKSIMIGHMQSKVKDIIKRV